MKRLLFAIIFFSTLGFSQITPPGGGGASTNPTSGTIPVKSGAVFIDSPESVSGGNVVNSGTYTATGFICSGANCYIDISFAAAPANPTGTTRRFFCLDGAGCGDLDSNGNINYIGNLPINSQSGTTYTVLATDAGKLTVFTNSGAIAVTLPQASVTTTSSFFTGRIFRFFNSGSGTVTITPTTSTINGASTLIVYPGNFAAVVSDGTNYQAPGVNPATVAAGTTLQVGSSPPTCPAGTSGGICNTEGTAITGGAGYDALWADSTAHRYKMNNNNGGAVQVVASGGDINTSDQVTVTHLAAALPVNQGGTSLATLTAHALYVGNGTSAPTAVGLGTNVTVLHGAAAGDPTFAVVTPSDAAGNTSGSGNFCLVTNCVMTTPQVTTIKDANNNPFIASSATASAVDGVTVTTAATANPATVTLAGSGTDTNINTAINAKGSGIVQASTFFTAASNRVTMTADWTCGTTGTVSSCVSATIVGSTGTPLTFTLPLQALSWHFQCDLVASQATGLTANNWNLLTATNGATNVTISYMQGDTATTFGGGATTDQASTTTTFNIGGAWTLGTTGVKVPVHIAGSIEGASASGTVVSLQLVAPTVGDLVTIYRGATCSVSTF